MEAELINVISNVGFPIGITLYFIIRFEKILNNNTQAIQNVVAAVEHCPKRKI